MRLFTDKIEIPWESVVSLGKLYYDPKNTAGFSSVAELVSTTESNRRNVEEWLPGQDTYALRQPVHKRLRLNPYTVTNIDDIWEMHLCRFSSLSRYNDKYKYFLNVIEILSRYAWRENLKDKPNKSIAAALTISFQNRKPITIQSDKGTKFVNVTVEQYLKR